jgi:hypothetical protein
MIGAMGEGIAIDNEQRSLHDIPFGSSAQDMRGGAQPVN